MELDEYLLMESNVPDIRFGPIDVYCRRFLTPRMYEARDAECRAG